MTKQRVLLRGVKRFRQKPSECAVASAATLANFFDPTIIYENVRDMIPYSERKDGLHTPRECEFLNDMGFSRVSVVSSDDTLVDFSWASLSKDSLLRKLKRKRAYYGRAHDTYNKERADLLVRWLEREDCDNNLIIDYDWRKYITRHLNRGIPVGANFNWTAMHKFMKGSRGDRGDITGDSEDHAVVIRGYDDKGVFIVDSHWEYYKGKWAKYRNGFYKVSWDKFLINTTGDLILVE